MGGRGTGGTKSDREAHELSDIPCNVVCEPALKPHLEFDRMRG